MIYVRSPKSGQTLPERTTYHNPSTSKWQTMTTIPIVCSTPLFQVYAEVNAAGESEDATCKVLQLYADNCPYIIQVYTIVRKHIQYSIHIILSMHARQKRQSTELHNYAFTSIRLLCRTVGSIVINYGLGYGETRHPVCGGVLLQSTSQIYRSSSSAIGWRINPDFVYLLAAGSLLFRYNKATYPI